MLTVHETAERLRVSPGAVYLLVRHGALASIRVGRRIVIAETVLANFIAAGGCAFLRGEKHTPPPAAA